ncbi:PepSY domain-containing protein (plasmid) [Rhizobium sp. YTUHZ044]|uniref:PepSY domain-containing protein n=1 Tax=Rhizobium sp. YTUHZ044 TaxID=2962678 RepID=UPI003DA87C08
MIRSLHRWFGLVAAVLIAVIALSGTALSIFPAIEGLTTPVTQDISVAELAARIQTTEPSVELIRRAPSGRITAHYFDGDQPASSIIDPATGSPAGSADTSTVERWLIELHRALLLDDSGRLIVASGAASLLTLTLSGLFLLARRAGGWRHMLKPAKGTGDRRFHAVISRIALPGLLLSSLSALWMTASTFGYLPEGAGAPPFPSQVSGAIGAQIASITLLQETPVETFRSLSFPAAGDASDVFTLKTAAGEGYIDQGSGELLAWKDSNWVNRLTDLLAMLHTGQGMAWLGLLLGVSALAVPVLSWTGLAVWFRGRGEKKGSSVSADEADTIILVGSEGGTTWGFAETLRKSLAAHGMHVHVGPMSSFQPARWPIAQRLILLAATYGDAEAPASAQGFLERFRRTPAEKGLSLAVLGFGDRSFPAYCGFAVDIAQLAEEKGWDRLLPYDTVDRQSSPDFARWGRDLAEMLGLTFELDHRPTRPKTWELSLVSRRAYGASVQATTVILRFTPPMPSVWQRLAGNAFPRFEAGDLVGILPEGSEVPRFYSIASGTKDGFLEICVRKQPGGLCSGQLTALEPGQTVTAFVRSNPSFRPLHSGRPVILIGAGTGIGPLAGFARANRARHPMYLYFGTRHPASDALYAEELSDWRQDGRLAGVSTAFSRTANPAYVQDILRKDAAKIGRLIAAGSQILVCGGRDMAAGVAAALSDILIPQGISLAALKAEGRYAEDVY